MVRRWQAPRAVQVAVSRILSHRVGSQSRRFNYSNGVLGWIVSSRRGVVANWIVRGYEAETAVKNLDVEEGEHLDFVVDSLEDYESDSFSWAPRIVELVPEDQRSAGMEPQAWTSEEGFAESVEEEFTALEQHAQVLLMTNEFAFRD